MRIAEGNEEVECKNYLLIAAQHAEKSDCFQSARGSIIVKENEIIGTGYNAFPAGKRDDSCKMNQLEKNFKSDRSCCVHAEQRAIMQALMNEPKKLIGSRIYYVRLGENKEPVFSRQPSCTVCSKMALDAGIAEFVLWHKEGITIYTTEEYNRLSFAYSE